MFAWSRLETWLAVAVSVLLVTGGVGGLLLDRHRGGGVAGPVSVEPFAAAAAAPVSAEPAGEKPGGGGAAAEGDVPFAPQAGAGLNGACPEGEPAAAPGVDTRININLAPASELERLPGIGPALAQRIVQYREQWGPFSDIADILEVPGIGPAKFRAIQDLIRVE